VLLDELVDAVDVGVAVGPGGGGAAFRACVCLLHPDANRHKNAKAAWRQTNSIFSWDDWTLANEWAAVPFPVCVARDFDYPL